MEVAYEATLFNLVAHRLHRCVFNGHGDMASVSVVAELTSKVLIVPYFGQEPEWIESYWQNAERLQDHGYDFLLENDEDLFREQVREKLGIVAPTMAGTGNIHDFRPALGFMYADEIKEYDFWGVTDFDCVYGRVEKFYPDSLLEEVDVATDHWEYLCGPWTLFRNNPLVNELFFEGSRWEEIMESPAGEGWMEEEFTRIANAHLRVRYSLHHAWTDPHKLLMEGDALYHDGVEVPFFHFRHTKKYPL